MADDDRPPREPPSNMLGKTSLVLGIIASTFVIFLLLCAGVAQQQGWLNAVKPIFGVLGGTCSFVGFASVLMGLVALFQKSRSRGIAIVGMILGMIAVLLFAAAVNNANK